MSPSAQSLQNAIYVLYLGTHTKSTKLCTIIRSILRCSVGNLNPALWDLISASQIIVPS